MLATDCRGALVRGAYLPQRELQAAKQLANQEFRAFLPRYWKNRRHARRVNSIDADGNIQFRYQLKEGQSLKVTAGPLADLVGRLEWLDDKGRVGLLLELLGGTVRVTLPQTLVAPS